MAQVQSPEVRHISQQQPRRCVRQLQTGQSQLSDALEPPPSAVAKRCACVRGWGQQLLKVRVLQILDSTEVQQLQTGTDRLTQCRDRRPGTTRDYQLLQTLQAGKQPHELFLGDVGEAQIQGDGLSADDATEHRSRDGALSAQVDVGPEPLVTAPAAPCAADPHAHTQLPVAQVGEDADPDVPVQDVGVARSERQQ